VSLIGNLEQFRLPNVLERIESHEKTGLLVVRQGERWVEFYFRNGCLLCIGPVRTSATLADRLLQDKIISQQVWQEVKHIGGSDEQSETRVAITLMERGYVTREHLRAWTAEKSLTVLSAILVWTTGEVYFEESTQPPSDRLLVSMSITSLIKTANVNVPSPQTQSIQTTPVPASDDKLKANQGPASVVTSVFPTMPYSSATTTTSSSVLPTTRMSNAPFKPKVDIAHVPTLMGTSQFLDEKGMNAEGTSNRISPETESLASFFNGNNDTGMNGSLPNTNEISFASLAFTDESSVDSPPIHPEIVKYPKRPKRIDTSFMLPDMVLAPADISALREQNLKVQITPDQWRVLTCVDGCNSLQMACQLLGLSPDVVCALAGELVAEGLIYVVSSEQVRLQSPMGSAPDLSVPGLANAYVAPGSTASSISPWSATIPALPSTDVMYDPSPALPFETDSQWGNGGNGATFIPGRGWVMTPQQMQPLHSSGALVPPSGVYAGTRS
jgi:Domain of unknown function (DUF4388)